MIQLLLKKISSLFSRGEKKIINPSLESLSPKPLEIDKIKGYADALKFGIDEDSVTNIALTGGYGSGKSSIIQSFKNSYRKDYIFLELSLSSFTKTDIEEKDIELSLLQQIIYHVDSRKIPLSRFKRIQDLSNRDKFLYPFYSIIWVWSLLCFYKFEFYKKLNPINFDFSKPLAYKTLFVISIFSFGLFFIVNKLYYFLINSKIARVNIKGELQIEKKENTALNSHIEELIYFFDRNSIDVVIIEDLDRFETSVSLKVFTKLRELNIMINNTQKRVDHKKLVFLYAIKDDIFDCETDKTKFFDLIIPVIPVINFSNSSEKLKHRIKSIGEKISKPSDLFLEDISSFIDDMRLLNNICNEYVLYYENLKQSSNLNPNKLFSIITYKNLLPKDFNALHKEQGVLFSVINKRKDIIIAKKNEIDIQITQLENRISEANNEIIESEKELKLLYLSRLKSMSSDFLDFADDRNVRYTFSQLIEDDTFDKVRTSPNIKYFYNYQNVRNSGLKFSNIEDSIGESYDSRLRIVRFKENGVDQSKNKINSLRKEKKALSKIKLKELIDANEIFTILNELEVSHNEQKRISRICNFFVKNGYIDEDYYDYSSQFHPVSITESDNEFLLNVRGFVETDHSYKLKKTANICRKIDDKYFLERSVFNFDLVDFLVENKEYNTKKVENLLSQFLQNEIFCLKFILKYLFNGGSSGVFLGFIIETDSSFIEDFLNNEELNDDEKDYLVCSIVKYVKPSKVGSELDEYLTNHYKPLKLLFEIPLKNVEAFALERQLKFKHLEKDIDSEKKALFRFIYNSNSYVLNQDNVEAILYHFDKSYDRVSHREQYYTTILKSDCEKLKAYINEDINTFMKVLDDVADNDLELESTLRLIYNNKDIGFNYKSSLIQFSKNNISNLEDINDLEIKELLITYRKVSVDWNNVINYFTNSENEEKKDIIKNYFDNSDVVNVLSKESLRNVCKDDDNLRIELSILILYARDLNLDNYKKMLLCIGKSWKGKAIGSLPEDKVSYLIEQRYVLPSEEAFDIVIENFSLSLIDKFIETSFSEFFDKNEVLTPLLTGDNQINILKSNLLSHENKLSFIELLDKVNLYKSKEFGSLVVDVLSKESNYSKLSYDVLSELFLCSYDDEKRIILLNSHFDNFNEKEIRGLLHKLSYDYRKLNESKKRTLFKNNGANRVLLVNLKASGLISSVKENKDGFLKVVSSTVVNFVA